MQNWLRLQHYPQDYLNLVHKYYAAHGVAYICTYYHLDIPNSTLDLDILDAGSYEIIGDFSGLVWEKITMLPIYNTEQIQPAFLADERGFGKHDQISSFNIPTLYNIQPTARDFVVFEEFVLNENGTSSDQPSYQVINFEKATNTYFSFWKINMKINHYRKNEIETQVRESFSFVDYEKSLYQTDTAALIYKMLEKNTKLETNKFFRPNIGWYFLEAIPTNCNLPNITPGSNAQTTSETVGSDPGNPGIVAADNYNQSMRIPYGPI